VAFLLLALVANEVIEVMKEANSKAIETINYFTAIVEVYLLSLSYRKLLIDHVQLVDEVY